MKKNLSILILIMTSVSCTVVSHYKVKTNEPGTTLYLDGKKIDENKLEYIISSDSIKKKRNELNQLRLTKEGEVDRYFVLVKKKQEYEINFNHKGLDQRKNNKKNVEVTKCIIVQYNSKKESIIDRYTKYHKGILYSEYLTNLPKYFISDTNNKSFYTYEYTIPYYNNELKNKNYIDTTNDIFKYNYLNKINLEFISNPNIVYKVKTSSSLFNNTFDIIQMNTVIKSYDIYGNLLYTYNDTTISEEYAATFIYNVNTYQMTKTDHFNFQNASNKIISNLFSQLKFQELLTDTSEMKRENNFTNLTISKPIKIVEKISDSKKASVTIKNQKGHGSGFFISNEGYILTNYHVIRDTTNQKVILNDGKEYNFKVLRYSKIKDLALIKIDIKNEFSFSLEEKLPLDGDNIFAIGTPSSSQLNQSISRGIVSGIRKNNNSTLIQTDASINAGNSGGAITNESNQVLGMVSSKLYGFGIEGISFAIPSNEIISQLKIIFK